MSEPMYHPWGTVTHDFWSAPVPGSTPTLARLTPDAMRTRLMRIAQVAQNTHLQEAAGLAAQLDQEVTAEYGEAHLHTVQVREVRGYLAALMADHSTGLGWYLHAVQLRVTIQGPTHPDVDTATRRAYSMWKDLPPQADRQRLGTDLLTIAADIHGADAPLVRHIREQLYARTLTAAAALQLNSA
ncbi:hypothetical protein ACFVZD_36840 [Streptomyces sp. NPDC058287]|uniref:hypothetical protein n=1 Tax=Streptomyces sp. NPDC058287 TaxID=3346423 RepID=UPI0036EB792B